MIIKKRGIGAEERTSKNNRVEAEVLLSYAKIECGKKDLVLPMLDAVLTNKSPESVKEGWSWKIAKFIEGRTGYVLVDVYVDVDVETGDWGLPVMTGGEYPTGTTINDKDNLMLLRQEVDDILNQTMNKISNFLSIEKKPKWQCKKCGRFLGKELLTVDEIKKLLRDFSIGKYWKCRSCKLPNYFIFTNNGISFKSILD